MSWGAIGGAAVTAGIGALFGGKSKKKATGFLTTTDAAIAGTSASSFTSTGGRATFRRDANTGATSFDFQRSAGVDRALADLRNSGTVGARNFAGLRSQVAGGFSSFRQARLANLKDSERRSIGSLRESLRARRLGGTSFENLAVSEERERYARLRDEVSAETGLAEIGLTRQLIDDEFNASMTGLLETLNQFNFESSLIANLTQGATALAGTIAQARVGLAQAAANVSLDADTGIGEAFAPLIAELGDATEGFIDGIDFGGKPSVGVGDINPPGVGGTPNPNPGA